MGRVKATALNTSTAVWNYYTYHGFTESNKAYISALLRTEQNKDFGFKYNYDANGNMTKLFVGTNTGGTDYTYSATETERYYYDALGQLTQVNYNDRNRKVVYTYDNAGNILSETVYDTSTTPNTVLTTNTYTYDDSSWGDLLTGYNNDTFTYDAIGNPLTYRDGITFTWNNGRQLQSYSKGSTNVSYTYDNSGLRLSKNVNGTQYTYLYHGGNLMQETVGTNILDYFYDASGKPLAVKYRTSENSSPEWYYYALNSRGDVIGLYTPSGNLYCTYTYDVWGNILSVKNANGVEVTYLGSIVHLQSLKYRGYVYDLETGLYYLQSRYYDPVTHRFINADELVSTGTGVLGYNAFEYCNNSPITRIDTNGHFWDTVFDIISLGFSIADVIANPSDPWAWVGLAADVIDLIPFVTCVGEGVKAARAVNKVADVVDDAHDIAKGIDNFSDATTSIKRGWHVGDNIDNLTNAGNKPSWSTVRQRYWKNEAYYNPDKYGNQLGRLKKGLAPLDDMGISKELHHPFGRKGNNFYNFYQVTRKEHRIIHYGHYTK